jgi:hypothetical protein
MGLDLYLGAGLAGGVVLYAGFKGAQAAVAKISKKAGDVRCGTIGTIDHRYLIYHHLHEIIMKTSC